MATVAPGVCRHCGCTEGRPCGYCRGVHGDVTFTDKRRLICADPSCARREADRLAAARLAAPATPSRYRGWGYGAIVLEKRRQARERRRRKGRAA